MPYLTGLKKSLFQALHERYRRRIRHHLLAFRRVDINRTSRLAPFFPTPEGCQQIEGPMAVSFSATRQSWGGVPRSAEELEFPRSLAPEKRLNAILLANRHYFVATVAGPLNTLPRNSLIELQICCAKCKTEPMSPTPALSFCGVRLIEPDVS